MSSAPADLGEQRRVCSYASNGTKRGEKDAPDTAPAVCTVKHAAQLRDPRGSNNNPNRTLKVLIALARSKPGEITYGSAGAGTNPHIAGELLNNLAKIKLVAVHYKGGGPATIATISGETQLYFVNAFPKRSRSYRQKS